MPATTKEVQLGAKINAVEGLWGESVVTTAALLRTKITRGDKYLAILWGIVDSLGQTTGASQMETIDGLLCYLKPYPDGAEIVARMLKLASNPQYADWINLSGQATQMSPTMGSTAFMQLAGQYVKSGGG